MIEITGFLLKHLYELMADDYTTGRDPPASGSSGERQRAQPEEPLDAAGCSGATRSQQGEHDDYDNAHRAANRQTLARLESSSREQETNQQIVSFLANNHLPDLICETFIELLFICVFLAVTWIFVMIIQLHCHQLQQPARMFYCNSKFLASLMYCNNKSHLAAC